MWISILIILVVCFVSYVAWLKYHKGDHPHPGEYFSGLGAILLAAAALVAAFKTDEIMTKIINVQETSERIENAVALLKIEVMELRKERANTQIDRFLSPDSPFLKSGSSESDIKNTLRLLGISLNKIEGVNVKRDDFENLYGKLIKENSTATKKALILNSLEFKEPDLNGKN